MIRDRGRCQFTGCHQTRHLKAHHLIHWADGGPTDLANAALLCGHHHRLIHRTESDGDQAWEINIAPDGIPEITPPRRIDPQRRPLRNTSHRAASSDMPKARQQGPTAARKPADVGSLPPAPTRTDPTSAGHRLLAAVGP